jgi:hypothetical protein
LQALVLERGEGPGRVADQALQLLSDQVGRQASLLAFSDVFRVVGLLVSAGAAAGAVDGRAGAGCCRGGGTEFAAGRIRIGGRAH